MGILMNAVADKRSGVTPSGMVGSVDKLNLVLQEARRELASSEARLAQLLERASQVASSLEQEQVELQRFLEEFALEPRIYNRPEPQVDGGTGPLFDIEAMRDGIQELAKDLGRSIALRSNLSAALQMVQLCQDQLSDDRAFRNVHDTADVRLQQAMNSAREDERRRLAREVHDGPAQVLTNAIYGVQIAEQIAKREPENVAEELGRVRQLLREGVAEIRRFMFNLRPTMLEEQGLAPTLKQYVENYRSFFARTVTLSINEPLPLMTGDQPLTIFRVVQEALQNVNKHAGQDAEASIDISFDDSYLYLMVKDSGRGFDPHSIVPRPGTGAGLPGMKERAKLIGAELSISSATGDGTEVNLKMRLRAQTGALGGAAPLSAD
jgi:two-component system, NarL family, sensor histidine kinase DegS